MKSIRIFDGDLNLLAEVDNYTSFYFTRKFRTYGDFTIEININLKNSEFLQKNNIILIQGSTNKLGIIKQRSIKLDESGEASEILTIKGFTLDYLFKKRIVKGTQSINSNSETVIKTLINDNCVNATNTDRNYPFFTIATNQNRGSILDWTARYSELSEEVDKISFNDNIGIKFEYNQTEILVDIIKSQDKTITSPTPVIFAVEFDNIKTQELTEDDLSYYNFAYIAGDGEGATRVATTAGSGAGLNRHETFLSISGNVVLELQSEAEKELAKNKEIFNMSGEILSLTPFEYEKDWDIGDEVTIKNDKWGVSRNSIITSITEVYQGNETNIEVEFGDSPTTLNDVLNNKFINSENEVRR